MKYDRESRKAFCAFFKDIKAKWRRYKDTLLISCTLSCFKFICAMGCSNGDC